MGQWIGTLGGLLMAALIVVLFLRFLIEMGVGINGKELVKVLVPITGTALLELMLGGVYYSVKADGVQILDIGTIWGEYPLLFQNFEPFNWYASMALGVYAFWNLYQLGKKIVGERQARNGVFLAMAVPGVYFLFLPVPASPLFASITLIIRVLLEDRKWRAVDYLKGRAASLPAGCGNTGYTILLAVLALLNGATIIMNLGV